MVVTAEACRPVPTFGLPAARSGGHWATHPPVQALVVPWSARKRDSVRPWAFTSTLPSPVLAGPTVAVWPEAVLGGPTAALADPPLPPLPPPPQPATAT